MADAPDPARPRFAAIQLVRVLGVAAVLVAVLALRGRLDLPTWAGWVLLPLGLACAFVAPLLLARKWRSKTP